MYERPFGQNDIFQLCSDNKDFQSCFLFAVFKHSFNRPQWTWVSILFLPLTPNMLFIPPISPAKLAVDVVLTFEKGQLLLLLDFYTDFICKVAMEAVSLIPCCEDFAVQWSQC